MTLYNSLTLDNLVKNSVYDILISTLKGEAVLNAYAKRGVLHLKQLVDIVIWHEIETDPIYFRFMKFSTHLILTFPMYKHIKKFSSHHQNGPSVY